MPRPRLAAILLACTALLTLCSCLPVPLGNPDKSTAEAKYLGAWTYAEAGQTTVVVIRPWDARTYLVDALIYTGDSSAPVPKIRTTFKGWLTTVKGYPFLTLQPIDTLSATPTNTPRKYLIAMLTLEGDQLTGTPLDYQYPKFADIGTATQLEKTVADNFDDVKMWVKPIVATKLNEGANPNIEKLAKLFETR